MEAPLPLAFSPREATRPQQQQPGHHDRRPAGRSAEWSRSRRMPEPVRGGHHAVPVGDPSAVRGAEVVRRDVGEPGRRHRRVEVRLSPLVVAQRLATGRDEEESLLPTRQRLQVPADPRRERGADPQDSFLMGLGSVEDEGAVRFRQVLVNDDQAAEYVDVRPSLSSPQRTARSSTRSRSAADRPTPAGTKSGAQPCPPRAPSVPDRPGNQGEQRCPAGHGHDNGP